MDPTLSTPPPHPHPHAPRPTGPEADLALVARLHEARRLLLGEMEKRIVGQKDVVEHLLVALFARGHCLFVGVPGPRQDAAHLHPGRGARTSPSTASSSRPTSCRPTSPAPTCSRRTTPPAGAPSASSPAPSSRTCSWPTRSTAPRPRPRPRSCRRCRSTASPPAAQTYPLDLPFLVFATQNPIEQEGTYPLPEAQLDRFMFYVERRLPAAPRRRWRSSAPPPAPSRRPLAPRALPARDPRPPGPGAARAGRRPRGALRRGAGPGDAAQGAGRARLREGAAWRGAPGRGPGSTWCWAPRRAPSSTAAWPPRIEDVRALAQPVLVHRIITNFRAESDGVTSEQLVDRLLEQVKP